MKETVIGWLKERAFDWAKDRIASKESEQEIRNALNAFIECESRMNELCNLFNPMSFMWISSVVF